MATAAPDITYPESDGKPMAENMTQYDKIVLIRENIKRLRPHDLVAADNLIYVREGTRLSQAPDVYVAVGRPYRTLGCYKVWEEDNVFPQVIVEVLSPGNRGAEMARKWVFYNRYGAEEYYIYDPDDETISAWVREPGGDLVEVPVVNGFVSPRIGFSIDTTGPEVVFRYPDGSPFLSPDDLFELAESEAARADEEKARADDLERQIAAIKAKLHAAGLNGD